MTTGPRSSDTATMPTSHARLQIAVLQVLTAFFVCRVVVQMIQYIVDLDVLPEFERWQSGALPYGVLFVLQLLVVAGQVVIIRAAVVRRRVLPDRLRRPMMVLAAAYFGGMLVRLISGLTFAAGNSWLDARLPTVFHLVLAAFLFVWVRLETDCGSARDRDSSDDCVQHGDQVVRRNLDLEATLAATDEDGLVAAATVVDRGR
jgi:hypothetical protein